MKFSLLRKLYQLLNKHRIPLLFVAGTIGILFLIVPLHLELSELKAQTQRLAAILADDSAQNRNQALVAGTTAQNEALSDPAPISFSSTGFEADSSDLEAAVLKLDSTLRFRSMLAWYRTSFNTPAFRRFLSVTSLKLSEETGVFLLQNGSVKLRIAIDARLPVLLDGDSSSLVLSGEHLLWLALKSYLRQTELQNSFRASVAGCISALASPQARTALLEKAILAGQPYYKPEGFVVPIIDPSQYSRKVEEVFVSKNDAMIQINGRIYDAKTFASEIARIIHAVDTRTPEQKSWDRANARIRALAADPMVAHGLKQRGWHFDPKVRSDSSYFYHDILDRSGGRIGSIAVQKSMLEYFLMDADDVMISSFRRLMPERNTALPTSMGELGEAVLLVGTHDKMADSIILAVPVPATRHVSLLSIPRDLVYRGRKINAIYLRFGPMELLSSISWITGITVKKYIAVDMMAFIELVDELGGIDLQFENRFEDHSYRVRVNGQWTSLAVRQGKMHLDGFMALALARSRNVDSDFGRARRQQDILAALKQKAADSGFFDPFRIAGMVTKLSRYVTTNVGFTDLITMALKYGSWSISSNHVLDTENVLDASTRDFIANDETVGQEYILIPKDGDWAVIRRYIGTILSNPDEG